MTEWISKLITKKKLKKQLNYTNTFFSNETSQACKLTPDPLGSDGDIYIEKFLNSQCEALFIAHHRDIVQTIKIW